MSSKVTSLQPFVNIEKFYKGQKLSFQSIMSVIQIILGYKVARIENNYQLKEINLHIQMHHQLMC